MKLIESYKSRVFHIYEDIKFVLLCNLDALARDGRMSLKQLNESRVFDGNFCEPLDLFKILFELQQKFKEGETKPEEIGLDSKSAILSLIDGESHHISSLYQTAKDLKIEFSDEFYSILSSLLEKGAKPKDFCQEIKD